MSPTKQSVINLEWQTDEQYGYQVVKLKQCEIHLERRMYYCDRGAFIAKVFPVVGTGLFFSFDAQDGFPRYYFDETRAKLEMEAWVERRGLA